MSGLPTASSVLRRAESGRVAADRVSLDYEGRFLRRRRLYTASGRAFLVDLPEVVSLDAGDCLVLDSGDLVEVEAALEPVIEVRGDLARLAWHIGNRHTPCEIRADRLVIRQDHVLEAMLRKLGATIHKRMAPFRPEGGAYGHGRTLGHSHT